MKGGGSDIHRIVEERSERRDLARQSHWRAGRRLRRRTSSLLEVARGSVLLGN